MDYKVEVITLAVSDVDKSLEFYTRQAGFALVRRFVADLKRRGLPAVPVPQLQTL